MPTPPPLIYPFRQALSRVLQQSIAANVAPTINMLISTGMADISSQSGCVVPQFGFGAGLANIRLGDLLAVSGAVICIVGAGFDAKLRTNTKFLYRFWTEIKVKVPSAGIDRPEDWEVVFQSIEDSMADYFCTTGTFILDPNSFGAKPLPTGSKFQQCWLESGLRLPQPVRSEEGVKRVPGWVGRHYAQIDVTSGRPNALGNL